MAFALLSPSRHDTYDFIDPTKHLKGAVSGKAILITGAGGGVGKGLTRAFALAGASRLFLAARKAEPLERAKQVATDAAAGIEVHLFPGTDIGSTESVTKLFASLPGVPDVLVNNAAIMQIGELSVDDWMTSINVNLVGAYRMCKAYVDLLKGKSRSGRIINISSNSSWRYMNGASAYSASKVGLNNLCEHVDKEDNNVRCFALHPGGVLDTEQKDVMASIPEHIQKLMIDKPGLPGGTAVYLCTESADFLGGRYVLSTWDMEELEKVRERVVEEDLLRTRVVGVVP